MKNVSAHLVLSLIMLRNYTYMGVFAACLLAMSKVARPCSASPTGILANGGLSLAISVPVLGMMTLVDRSFRNEARSLLGLIAKRRTHTG